MLLFFKLWTWLVSYYKSHVMEEAGDIYADFVSISMLIDETADSYIMRADT